MLRDARSAAESPAQFGSPNVRLVTRIPQRPVFLERDYRAKSGNPRNHTKLKSFVRALSCDFVDRPCSRDIRHETDPGHLQTNSLTGDCVLCYYPARQREVSAGFATDYPWLSQRRSQGRPTSR